jgi:hypothetical protein
MGERVSLSLLLGVTLQVVCKVYDSLPSLDMARAYMHAAVYMIG